MKRTSYITADNLLKHLLKAGWFPERAAAGHRPWRVGICVSGGPDSMALAYLLRHMPHPFAKDLRAFLPHALIIDHDARDESSDEALWVKHQLETLDIKAYVQKLEWRSDVDPKNMRGFEMKARDMRYRALIRLAKASNLHDLFTGHHEDDQVETLMLRLLRDRHLNPLSFRGMPMTSTIPTAGDHPDSSAHSFPVTRSSLAASPGTALSPSQSEIYRAGVRLHRPLLAYQKDQLIATCEQFNIPYIHDRTNFNPRLTPRNAARHIRSKHVLPTALRSEALLRIPTVVSQICCRVEEEARFFLNKILHFDLHSETGVLHLSLRDLPSSMIKSQSRGFSFFMQRIVSLVSPLNDDLLPFLLSSDHTAQLLALCLPDVLQQCKRPESFVINQVTCAQLLPTRSSDAIMLRLSRQPMSSTTVLLLTQKFESEQAPHARIENNHCYSQWLLWDRRFWIRIYGTPDTVNESTVKPYDRSDVLTVRQMLKETGRLETFESTLSTHTPGDIRFTLPVLVVSGEIAAFPTLNLSIKPSPPVTWQVLYPRNQRATEFFFPRISDGDEITWSLDQHS